jgi:Flp pilus assembly protein TadD
VHQNLAVVLANEGRLGEARQHFAEVLRLDPNYAGARQFFLSNMVNS